MKPLRLASLVLLAAAFAGGRARAQGGAPDTVMPPRPAEAEAAPAPAVAKPAGATAGSSSTAGATASTAAPDTGAALALDWDVWWHFHQHEFLDLRGRVHAGQLVAPELAGDPALAAQFARAPRPTPEEIAELVEPRLRAHLAEESDLVAGALVGLARLGARSGRAARQDARASIAERIASPVRGIAETAVLALGILGDEAGVETLAALLADGAAGRKLANLPAVPYRMRSLAAYGLGLIGQGARTNRTRQVVCRALTDALAAAVPPATDTQVACLLALGMTPLDPDPREARTAPWISRHAQLDFLHAIAQRPGPAHLVRAHAWASLARLAPGAGAAAQAEVAQRARALLAEHDGDLLLREACILGLGELVEASTAPADGEGAEVLFALHASGSPAERDAARLALLSLAGRARDEGLVQRVRAALYAELDAATLRRRAWAACGLGVLEARRARAGRPVSPETRVRLRALWERDQGPDVRSATALALGLARDPEAPALLAGCLLQGGDDALRGYCALGLGLCGRTADVPLLRTILRESTQRPFVLESAAVALGLLGEKSVVPDLLAGLEASLSQTSQGWFALAVGLVGDVRALPVLVERLQDEKLTRRSRAYLAVALGMICESEPLPWAQPIAAHLAWRATSETLYSGAGQGVLEFL